MEEIHQLPPWLQIVWPLVVYGSVLVGLGYMFWLFYQFLRDHTRMPSISCVCAWCATWSWEYGTDLWREFREDMKDPESQNIIKIMALAVAAVLAVLILSVMLYSIVTGLVSWFTTLMSCQDLLVGHCE